MPPSDFSPTYRSPRLRVLVNGQVLSGACEAEVGSNNHYSADRFAALVLLGPDAWADADFWSSQCDAMVEIQMSLDGGKDFTSMITGLTDFVSIDMVRKAVHIQGRDLSAALIEAETQETFANRTSSEIATIFAQRHNLAPYIVPTATPVGRFYESDHESLTLSQYSAATTEWDLLVYLARQESYDLFVNGNGLYFQPVADATAFTQILRLSDMMDIRMERTVTLARNIQVTVKSWNSAQQTSFSECAIGSLSPTSYNGTPLQSQYSIVRPNLTPDKAAALARQRLSELSRHERVIEFSMPGDLTLTPRSVILLDGTETEFDQPYYVESVDRSFKIRSGFLQHVRACGSSPRTVTTTTS